MEELSVILRGLPAGGGEAEAPVIVNRELASADAS
jgi:hypothetical protein